MTDVLKAQFEAAVEQVRNAPADGAFKPDNDYKLKMYALFRQATDGDVSGKRPGMLDVIGRFKYDAWTRLKGTSKVDAMKRYIAEVEAVQKRYG